MALYQFPCTLIAATGIQAGTPLGRALPDGATVTCVDGGFGIGNMKQIVHLPAGLTLQMADADAAKILAAQGPYTGTVPKKSTPDWVVS